MTLLHERAGPTQLAVVRVGVFGLWLVQVLRLDVSRFAAIPPGFATPPGVMGWFPVEEWIASPVAPRVLQVLAAIGCALCIAGVRPFPLVALPTSFVLLLFDGLSKSVGGFTNHAQAAPLYCAFLLALFPAGDAWSVVRRPPPERPSPWSYRLPLVLCALALAAAYAMIGLRRVVAGGVDLFSGPSLETWMVSRSLKSAAYGFDHGLLVLGHRWLVPVAAAAMLVTTIFEILTPLALRRNRFRVVWLWVIVPFHISTLLTMRIFFWENLVLIALLFTTLPDRVVGVGSGTARWRRSRSSATGSSPPDLDGHAEPQPASSGARN